MGRQVQGSLCFFTNSQSIQETWALELMRAWVSMSFRECEGSISLMGTWMDCLEREASGTFETVIGEAGTHID